MGSPCRYTIAQALYGTVIWLRHLPSKVPSRPRLPDYEYAETKLDTAKFEIMDYNELIPELVDAAKFDTASSKSFYMFIYIDQFWLVRYNCDDNQRTELWVWSLNGDWYWKIIKCFHSLDWIRAHRDGWSMGRHCFEFTDGKLFVSSSDSLSGSWPKSYERFGIEPVIYTALIIGYLVSRLRWFS